MALRIINAGPDPEKTLQQIHQSIEGAIPGAAVEARCASPGHFEIRVTSEAFADLPKLKQHQMVYGAITAMMTGEAAPIHAVDRLECRLP
jgi:acid stress-induced BolA-like protein IbaG/YrbA